MSTIIDTARPFDRALADTLVAQWPDAPPGVAALITQLGAAIADGHSCLALDPSAIATLRAWSAVGDGEPTRPLVIDAAGRLYLRRYWQYEARIAMHLRRLAAATSGTTVADEALLERHFPRDGSDPAQRDAGALALARRLAVILGGPGTGKTWTLVRIVAMLADAHAVTDLFATPWRIAIAATTGKAAQRINEALAQQPATAPLAKATTVHALLGMRRDTTAPRFDARAPLPVDAVVIDEASMLDLPMMSHLLAALPDGARLVLVGDPDQLASVEAGSVLAELRREHDEAPTGPVGSCVTTLRRAQRFAGDSALARALAAIRDGDDAALFDALSDPSSFEWHDALPADPAATLARHPAMQALAADGEVEARLVAFTRTRALAALRQGPFGVAAINAAMRRARGGRRHGEPVLVEANAPLLDLANGDVGIYLDGEEPTVRFAGADGVPREWREAELPRHSPAWAMTVHKAQGSEFATVLVLLPAARHELVTREWLYTALSRARERVVLWATRAVLADAVATPARRRSGLRDRLREPDPPAAAARRL